MLIPMPTPASRARTPRALFALASVALLAAACGSGSGTPAVAVTDDTYAVVNGRQITRDDVEKAFRRGQASSQVLSEEETLGAKLDVLDDLIVEDLLMAKARELNIQVPDKEIDDAYTATKRNLSDADLQEELKRRGLTTADVREGLRRELLARKVLEREVIEKVNVPDAAVADFYNANRAQFNIAEDSYRLAQIAVTPVPDPQQANRAGDDATTPAEAQQKAAGLMRRLQEGAAFDELARDHSEDPQTAPRGGDLGLVPVSALQRTTPALRDAILKTKPGSVTPVVVNGTHMLVAVMGIEKAGQRDLSMPEVRQTIMANLRGRKEQLLRAAYLTALRSDADVVNYYARRLVTSQSQSKPASTAAPAAEGTTKP